jgi:hypothetical protein
MNKSNYTTGDKVVVVLGRGLLITSWVTSTSEICLISMGLFSGGLIKHIFD